RSRRPRAGPTPRTRTATTTATTPSTPSGTRSPPTATASRRGWRRTCWRWPDEPWRFQPCAGTGPGHGPGGRVHEGRGDGGRGRAAARERERRLRRDRAPEHGLQPRARDARARLRARLRERHDRREADAAAALDRRRRARRDGGRRRLGAGDLRLLAAGGTHRRRLPRGRADRPLRQPEQHRDRRLRAPEGAAPGRRRRARDRTPLPRDPGRDPAQPARLRRAARLPLELRRAGGGGDHRPRRPRARPGDARARAHGAPAGRRGRRGRRGDRLAAARGPGRGRVRAAGRRGARGAARARGGAVTLTPAEDRGDPPYDHPDYRSSALRAPRRLYLLPEEWHDPTGPVFGESDVDPADADLTRQHEGEPLGERTLVSRPVLDDAGRPIPRTLVEIWQANAAGRYAHQVDRHPAPLDPNFTGAGRCLTDADGGYRFVTIKPGAYPWRNHPNAWR